MFPFMPRGPFGPFGPHFGFVPPIALMPHPVPFGGWTSSLDRRTNPGSMFGDHQTIGNGLAHEDIISFSLTDDKDPSDCTLTIRHHVKPCCFQKLETKKLKMLLAELYDLQSSRVGAFDAAPRELPERQHTITTLEEVLKARNTWLESDDDDDKDKDEDDDDDDKKDDAAKEDSD